LPPAPGTHDGSQKGVQTMNAIKMFALALIVAGVLGLAYGGFSYTRQTHEAKIGPIELSVQERQTVNVPVWAGIGAILIGGALLLFGSKSR
jgi:TRAP-type C4-dicarboxylate transport system permease small subunit